MNKCKHCDYVSNFKGEAATTDIRKHWATKHKQELTKLQIQLSTWESTKRWCLACGVSQITAGYIHTCSKCGAWYCPAESCVEAHRRCGHKTTNDQLGWKTLRQNLKPTTSDPEAA